MKFKFVCTLPIKRREGAIIEGTDPLHRTVSFLTPRGMFAFLSQFPAVVFRTALLGDLEEIEVIDYAEK